MQETWASPALLAGGFAPSTCGGALGDSASYGSRGWPSAALRRFCPRNKCVSDRRHFCVTLTDRVHEVGRAEAVESTSQDFWGVQGEKGFREIQESTTEVCVYACVMGSDFI